MANWLDWFDPRKSGAILDEAYKNSTLRGGNVNRQLQLINRLDEQNDKARGIKVHTIPRDTRSKSQPKGSGNPGSLGILDPRVWAAMNKSRQNIAALIPKSDQTKTKVHPWEGLIPGIGAAEESAKGQSLDELMRAANIPGAAKEKGVFSNLASTFSKPLESENLTALTKETTKSTDPPSSGSTIFTQNKEGEALGVMTRNQRKQWEAANPNWQKWQPEGKGYTMDSVLNKDGGLKDNKAINKSIQEISSKGIIDSLKIQGTNIVNKGKEMLTNAIASLPKSKEIAKVGMFDGTKAGTAKGMNTVAAGIELLAKLTKKQQKQSTAGMEGKGGNIAQVAVPPNVNFDEFGNLVG